MRKTLYTFLVGISLLFSSCLDFPTSKKEEKLALDSDFNTIEINDTYSIAIPKHMKVATNLNDEASLQYQNVFKETYMVVLDEPKQDLIDSFKEVGEWNDAISTIENYKNFQLQFMEEVMEISERYDEQKETVNGQESIITGFDGTVEEVLFPISYTIAFVEGDEDVYMIMAWTLKNKRDKFKGTYLQSIRSFKEI